MARLHGYKFTHCPVTLSWWTKEECLKVHYFIVSKALEFSRVSPHLEFGDFYDAGYSGYLQALPNLRWTIQSHGLSYVCTRILSAMHKEWSDWYGRKGVPKGEAKRKGLYDQLSLNDPIPQEGSSL